MGITDKIKSLFQPPPIPERYRIPFFRDINIQAEIARNGFAIRPLLSPPEIQWLKQKAFETMDMLPDGYPTSFWPSGRAEDSAIRNFAGEAVASVVPKELQGYFEPEKADFMGGTFLVKPPGQDSELWPHQDSSHVDEEKLFSVYAWVVLEDVNERNGALHVIPGSHLFGNPHRSLNVPWDFKGLEKTMLRIVEPLPMRAGEVCFFDSATIHYSPKNLSKDYRVAMNYFIKPSFSPMLHHFIDEETPPESVEVFSVDIDFFHSHPFEKRPPAQYPKLRTKPHLPRVHTEESFLKLWKSCYPKGRKRPEPRPPMD